MGKISFLSIIILIFIAFPAKAQYTYPIYWNTYYAQSNAEQNKTFASYTNYAGLSYANYASISRKRALDSGATNEDLLAGDTCLSEYFSSSNIAQVNFINGNTAFDAGVLELRKARWDFALSLFNYASNQYILAKNKWIISAEWSKEANNCYIEAIQNRLY